MNCSIFHVIFCYQLSNNFLQLEINDEVSQLQNNQIQQKRAIKSADRNKMLSSPHPNLQACPPGAALPNFAIQTNSPHILPQSTQKILSKTETIIHGAKKMTSLLFFFVPLMLTAPLVAYYMAIKKGQEHKFPHPTITDTACHYPQDIQFRLIMAGSGSFISMIYWVLFRWMKYQKQRTEYPGPIYGPLYYIGQASVWGFMIAMGTIDGQWYPDLHTNSAIFFFVTLFVIVVTQTIVLRDIYLWDSSIMTQKSFLIKMILAIYVVIVWVCMLIGVLTHPDGVNDDQNVYIVILEWNSVYICIFWILSYYPQWADIRITLTEEKNQ